MGFRFRRSIKLGKHTRLNLSKSGVGISTGVKGFRVSAGPKGIRTTTSSPGTGISHTQQYSATKPKPKRRVQKKPEREKELEGVIGLEVYGEKVYERPIGKPPKPMTQRERNKAQKIIQKRRKAEHRIVKRGRCLGVCLAVIGVAVLIGIVAVYR